MEVSLIMLCYIAKVRPSPVAQQERICLQCRSLIPGLGRSPGEGHGNPLQYYFLENPMDIGAWQATVHRVAESDTTEATEHARTAKVKRCYRCD